MFHVIRLRAPIAVMFSLLLAACGGGGGGGSGNSSPPANSSNWGQMVWDQGNWN